MSTGTRYRHLFTPLRLGPVTVQNRIVFSALLTYYAVDGLPTEQHAAYYAARAAGGAGLIITEEHSTHRTDWPYEKLIHGFNPAVVDGYRRITDAVRDAIGGDRALGVRICGDELIEGGTGIEEAVEVARLVDATGQVDYINTSIGVATATLYMIEASMQVPPGYALFIPSAIREAVGVPVVGVGRFKDPLQADRALAEGLCDLVGVVRGQIADPDFAIKARSGHATDIRTCLSCNQECVGRMGPVSYTHLRAH